MLEEENTRQCWKYVVQEEYTRALNDDPRVGRLYHHLAVLVRSQSAPQSDERFDATVLELFYFTKSLVVEKPFIAARDSLLTVVIDPIVARTKEEGEKPASVPPNDKDHFLTAVASLILASLEPELLRARGYKTCKEHHLQAVYAALGKIGRPARAEQAQTSRIHPRYVLIQWIGSLLPLTNYLQRPPRSPALPIAAGNPLGLWKEPDVCDVGARSCDVHGPRQSSYQYDQCEGYS